MGQCKKVGYSTKKKAKKALNRISKTPLYVRGKFVKKARQFYKCKFCGKYHITSQK